MSRPVAVKLAHKAIAIIEASDSDQKQELLSRLRLVLAADAWPCESPEVLKAYQTSTLLSLPWGPMEYVECGRCGMPTPHAELTLRVMACFVKDSPTFEMCLEARIRVAEEWLACIKKPIITSGMTPEGDWYRCQDCRRWHPREAKAA